VTIRLSRSASESDDDVEDGVRKSPVSAAIDWAVDKTLLRVRVMTSSIRLLGSDVVVSSSIRDGVDARLEEEEDAMNLDVDAFFVGIVVIIVDGMNAVTTSNPLLFGWENGNGTVVMARSPRSRTRRQRPIIDDFTMMVLDILDLPAFA